MDRSEDDLSKDDIELELESDTSVAVVEDEVDKEELIDDSERSEESKAIATMKEITEILSKGMSK